MFSRHRAHSVKRAYRITGFLARLLAVLENVFAEKYSDHLGGIKRVLDSDVAVGERLPGAGRLVYVGLLCEL